MSTAADLIPLEEMPKNFQPPFDVHPERDLDPDTQRWRANRRELIVEGAREGLAAARARGQRLGRPPALTAEQIRQARAPLPLPDQSVSSIARLLNVSRSTLYRNIPELRDKAPAGLPVAPPTRAGDA